MVKAFNRFYHDLSVDGITHAHTVSQLAITFFVRFYEDFLLVVLCKFDLDWLKFSILQWLLCSAVLLCSLEAVSGILHILVNFTDLCSAFWSDGYVDVVDLFKSFFNNFWSVEKNSTYFPPRPLPKDVHVLTTILEPIDSINNIDSIDSVNKVETTKSNPYVKRPYSIYAIAFGLVYLGMVVASYAY